MILLRCLLCFSAIILIILRLHFQFVVLSAPIESVIHGTIVKIQQNQPDHVNFIFNTTQNKNIYLSWYHAPQNLGLHQSCDLNVRLKPPHALHNPAGFDFDAWLHAQKIYADGYVKADHNNNCESSDAMTSIAAWREKIRHYLLTAPIQERRFVLAITLGDRELLQQDDWQVLQTTGTNHLFAIAGLHMGVLAALIYLLINSLLKSVTPVFKYMPRQKWALLFVAAILIPYAQLVGYELPAQRALFGLLFISILVFLKRQLYFWHQFFILIMVILIFSPELIYSSSFYLSFGAIAVIAFARQGIVFQNSKIRSWAHIQFALFLGLIPLNIWFFGNVTLVAPIANLITIPWVTLCIVPSCLLAAVSFFIVPAISLQLFKFAGWQLNYLWWYLSELAHFRGSNLQEIFYSNSTFILIIFAVSVFILLPLWRWRILLLPMFLLIGSYAVPTPKQGEVWLTVLDVGQGLSVLIRTQKHVLLYDAGLPVVLPYLQKLHLTKLDTLIISHGDMDHRAGVPEILQQTAVSKILTSMPNLFAKNNAQHCYAGQKWQWDGVQFAMLGPGADQPEQDNNSSCVLLITDSIGQSILLPGDIQAPQEAWLLAQNSAIKADVVVAPHHGSGTSSSWPFLLALRPKVVIFSTGFENRYHFPAPAVVARYRILGAKTYNTACNGSVQAQLERPSKITINPMVKSALCQNNPI